LTTAIALARNTVESTRVVLLHVTLTGTDSTAAEARARNAFRRAAEGLDYPVEERVVTAPTAVDGILQAAGDCDLIVIGASKERLFRNLLLGNVSSQVAEQAKCPVMLVKRRSSMLNALLRETVLMPVRSSKKTV
jgi:nucleotide-binding universal stress UspA family protein